MGNPGKGQIVPEVLDLTHSLDSGSTVSFDNPHWEDFLPQLKPIGLNLLLNHCRLATHYNTFLG